MPAAEALTPATACERRQQPADGDGRSSPFRLWQAVRWMSGKGAAKGKAGPGGKGAPPPPPPLPRSTAANLPSAGEWGHPGWLHEAGPHCVLGHHTCD